MLLNASDLSRDGGRLLLVPVERLCGEVSLCGLLHLRHGAVDALVRDQLRVPEPVVLVPPDEEPHVLRTEQTLQ